MLRVRPIRGSDIESFIELARLSGTGFTSLPDDPELLQHRIEISEVSFAKQADKPGEEGYLLVLEDMESGKMVGCSAVKVGVGLSKPFFSYKMFSITQVSPAVNRRFDMDMMVLVNEYQGDTEVGTLFVHPDFRGNGAGSLIARARYLLIATAPDRFSRNVLSELRGVIHDDGSSPFYEHLAKTFFHLEFDEVDFLSGVTDKQFILDLMPKYPIYVDLLPKEARDVIGKTHHEGIGARKLLEKEGFHWERVIDIFDGGPTLSAPRDNLDAVRHSRLYAIKEGKRGDVRCLLANEDIHDFRVAPAFVTLKPNKGVVVAEPEVLRELEVGEGHLVRFIEN